jgi:D-hexose-6-phosphate mutarotase
MFSTKFPELTFDIKGSVQSSWAETQQGKLQELAIHKISKHHLDSREVDFGFDELGQIRARLVSEKKSVLEVLLHSGAPVSFRLNRGQDEIAYMNPWSQRPHGGPFDPAMPPRGGWFDCLPAFGPNAPGGPHGLGRLCFWKPKKTSIGNMREKEVKIHLELGPSDIPENLPQMQGWEKINFRFQKIHTLTDTSCHTLNIVENFGTEPFEIRPCYHDYFSTENARKCVIVGIHNSPYADMIGHSTPEKQAERFDDNPRRGINTGGLHGLISPLGGGEVERVFENIDYPTTIRDFNNRRLITVTSNLTNRVVWNPGIAKGNNMADFDNRDNNYLNMVCYESLAAESISVPPGEKVEFWRKIDVAYEPSR